MSNKISFVLFLIWPKDWFWIPSLLDLTNTEPLRLRDLLRLLTGFYLHKAVPQRCIWLGHFHSTSFWLGNVGAQDSQTSAGSVHVLFTSKLQGVDFSDRLFICSLTHLWWSSRLLSLVKWWERDRIYTPLFAIEIIFMPGLNLGLCVCVFVKLMLFFEHMQLAEQKKLTFVL